MLWTIGCLYGASSVALGAFGAHGLKKRIADPQRIANWSTAAQYQVCTSFPNVTRVSSVLTMRSSSSTPASCS